MKLPRILFLGLSNPVLNGLLRGFEDLGVQVAAPHADTRSARGEATSYPDVLSEEAALRAIDRFKPDYLFADGGISPDERRLHAGIVAKTGLPFIFWAVEDPTCNDILEDYSKFSYLMLTTDREHIDNWYKPHGIQRVACVPFACNPNFHKPGRRDSLLAAQVAFAGNNYWNHPYRLEGYRVLFDPLIAAGVPVQFWGNHWWREEIYPWRPPVELYQGYLHHYRLADLCASVDFVLGVHSVGTSTTMQAMRTFEVMASEGFFFTHWSPAIEAMFAPNHRYLVWSKTPEETMEHFNFYKSRPDIRHSIARCGRENVLLHHNYQRRAEYILSVLDETA